MRKIVFLSTAIAVALCLTACGAQTPDVQQQRLTTLTASYGLLTALTDAYAALPVCQDQGPPVCSQAAVVAQITKARQVANVAIAEAKAVLAASDSGKYAEALTAAFAAIAIYEQALQTYGVKKA